MVGYQIIKQELTHLLQYDEESAGGLMTPYVVSIRKDQTVQIKGVGLDGFKEPEEVLNCGNSGTTMRLMLGLLVGRLGRHFVLTGDESLRKRPMQRLGNPLKLMGAEVNGRE